MSLRELANRLGLSQTTVSRALNGYPEVSAETRARVAAEAQLMNYAPNARARSLATGRSMAVGHVLPEMTQHELVNPIFADFIAGAGKIYSAAGFDMLLTLVADTDEDRTYRRLRERGRVDGIVVHVPRPDDPRIGLLREIDIPFVVHGRARTEDTDYSWLDMDNAAAFRDATRHLIGLGHRRIALLNGDETANFAQMRRLGVEQALQEAGLSPCSAWFHSDQMTEFYGHRTAGSLLDSTPAPTAFVASSIVIASGIRRAIEERGLRMGRDVSVVTHDDGLSYLPNGPEGAPIFTAVHVSIRQAGEEVAKMLLRLISTPSDGPLHRLQAAKLVQGSSTGPAPQGT